MPIYFSWFITALLFGKWWFQQSQPTAKWAPFILREIGIFHQLSTRRALFGTGLSSKRLHSLEIEAPQRDNPTIPFQHFDGRVQTNTPTLAVPYNSPYVF